MSILIKTTLKSIYSKYYTKEESFEKIDNDTLLVLYYSGLNVSWKFNAFLTVSSFTPST